TWCPVSVRTIDLPIDVTCVDEQNGFGTRRFWLTMIEKPQRAGQCNRIKHVRPDGNDHVYRLRLDQLLAYLLFRCTSVRSRVGHHESSAAFRVQRRIEQLNPKIVRVVRSRQTKRESPTRSD